MRRPGGYAHWFNGDLGVKDHERDTFTCHHCNRVVFVEPFQDPAAAGGWCLGCAKLICATCADTGHCTPFEQQIEQQEARERRLLANWGHHR